MRPTRDPIGSAFVYGLGCSVMLAWLASVAAEILSGGSYSTPIAVHGLMGTVVGSVFADAGLRRARARIDGGDPPASADGERRDGADRRRRADDHPPDLPPERPPVDPA